MVVVRKAIPTDLDALEGLYAQFRSHRQGFDRTDVAHVFDRIIASDHLILIVADLGGTPVSTCYLNIIDNLTHGGSPYAVIENVVTDELFRGRGYARLCLEYATEFAFSSGCYKVMLMTGRADLVPFYEACGFKAGDKHGLQIRADWVATGSPQ